MILSFFSRELTHKSGSTITDKEIPFIDTWIERKLVGDSGNVILVKSYGIVASINWTIIVVTKNVT
jgi:hypothetical protein